MPAAPAKTVRRARPLLGTVVEVGAVGVQAEAAVAAAFASLAQSQARWSFQDPDSALSRLNGAGGAPVPLDRASCRLLRLALGLMRASGGRFDPTVGGRLVAAGRLPAPAGGPFLPRGTADDLELHSNTARLRRPVLLTLDGIAKGYAVDLALAALFAAGGEGGWVNAGGDLRVAGAVTLPLLRRELDGRMRALGAVQDVAVASSRVAQGDDGFPALLVGPDGTPLQAGVFTVLARRAWRADALTKVAAATPAGERSAMIARLGGQLWEENGGREQDSAASDILD